MGYSARQSDVTPIADVLTDLWRRNLPVGTDDDLHAKLRWYYLDGPEGPGQAILLESTGQGGTSIVGCLGIGIRRFSIAGRAEPVRAALLADLVVEKRHRTLLPALVLTRAARAAAHRHPFHYGYPNPSAVGVFERLGYRRLGEMHRWVRILRHASYVERVVPSRVAAAVAGACIDAARLAQAGLGSALGLHTRLIALEQPDERIDHLWEQARSRFGVIGWRNAAFLRWRFFARPNGPMRLFALEERRGRSLAGYAVIEQLGTVIHIRDFLARTDADTARLFDHLAIYAWRRGGTAISVSFLGTPAVEAVLAARAFVRRDDTRTVIFDAAQDASTPAADVKLWYLTDGDEDT